MISQRTSGLPVKLGEELPLRDFYKMYLTQPERPVLAAWALFRTLPGYARSIAYGFMLMLLTVAVLCLALEPDAYCLV